MPTTYDVLKAAITGNADTLLTSTMGSNGLLPKEVAKQFLEQTFEATNLSQIVRHELHASPTGQINKIGIARRITEAKTENYDSGYRAKPQFTAVEYATTAVRVPWEVTEETYLDNIEGEALEGRLTRMMTTRVGVDREDLCINGDTDTPTSDDDSKFLRINDGWLKQIANGGHVLDLSTDTSYQGGVTDEMFWQLLDQLPNKYANKANLKWLMSPRAHRRYLQYLIHNAVSVGGIITDARIEAPCGIAVVEVESMPDDKIILADPDNLVIVSTYAMKIRKTDEGESAIMLDKRFYVIHYDFDPIVEELDATAIATGVRMSVGEATV